MERRTFVKNTALATAGFSFIPSIRLRANEDKKIRIASIGVGLRGQDHLDNLLRRNDVDVIAICDIDERMLGIATEIITRSGKTMPQIFKGKGANAS